MFSCFYPYFDILMRGPHWIARLRGSPVTISCRSGRCFGALSSDPDWGSRGCNGGRGIPCDGALR